MKIAAFTLLFWTCVVSLTWQPKAVAEDIRPGEPIEYKPMFPDIWKQKKRDFRMVPWEGKHVVFLTTSAELDRKVMARFIERLDGGWKLYADFIGKSPRSHMTHNNKPTIAAVPDSSYTCGVGCGHIGFSGIEVGGFYAADHGDYAYNKGHPNAFSHYFFYEMGRNYYLFENRHSAFTTGFSVFMRYVCMDALKCEDREAETRKKIEAVEGELSKSGLSFLKAFTSVTGSGGDEYVDLIRGYPSAQKEIYASVMLKLRRDYGGDEWVKRFFKFLWQCPNIPWEPEPKDAALSQAFNWLVAASCAAKEDLTPVFADRWKMPVEKGMRDALKAVDWKQADLSPSSILGSLPREELPKSLKTTLSVFLTPEQKIANRNAAQKMIELGGVVKLVVDGSEFTVKSPNDLPTGPFEIRSIHFEYGNSKVNDESLASLKGVSALKELRLGGAVKVTDVGISQIKSCKAIMSLSIDGTKVTDEAFDTLTNLTGLETLTMNGTRVTDRGIEKLATMKSLKLVWLSGTTLTDDGLKELGRLPNLAGVQLANTKVTDRGVDAFRKSHPKVRIDR